jgi:hypothetical protein
MAKKSAKTTAKAAKAKKATRTVVAAKTAKAGAKQRVARRAAAQNAARKTVRTITKPATTSNGQPRRLKQRRYKSLRLQQRIKHPVKLPTVWRLTRKASLTLWRYRRLFTGIAVIYGLLTVVLAQGLSGGTDVASLKTSLDKVFTGQFGFLASSLSILVTLVGTAGSGSSSTSSQSAEPYQVFLALVGSLAIIWALRQVLAAGSGVSTVKSKSKPSAKASSKSRSVSATEAGVTPRIRDAYYRGMYPLIPFLLVLLMIGLQLLPLVVGAALYSLVINNGIAVLFIEKFLWALLYGLAALLTLYMLSSSLFALYIVTLPDMTPLRALRSARELVRYRRWTVLRKILWLPVLLLLVLAVIMVPIITLLTPLTQYVFFVLTVLVLVVVHAYMYTLYRELLNE